MSGTVARWTYSAEDSEGGIVSGSLQATDEPSAIGILRSKKLLPITLKQSRETISSKLGAGNPNGTLSLPELATITQRLSDLLGAGLPLARALDVAHAQSSSDRQSRLFAHLEREVRAGRPLSKALSNGDLKSPRLMVALIRASENLGVLPEQFSKLADHYARSLKLRREIIAQLAYPAALLILIMLTLIFLSFFVLPQFAIIFENASAEPPIETRIALSFGAFIRANLIFAPFAALLTVLGWKVASRRYSGAIENLLLRAPVFGRHQRGDALGRYCRALSTLLGGGAALSNAMPLAAETVSYSMIRAELKSAESAVRTGDRLSVALTRYCAPSKEMVSFLEVGDETGELARMAGEAAKFAENKTHSAISQSMSLLGPALTAVMGLMTAGVIAAVMSGVLSLNDAVY